MGTHNSRLRSTLVIAMMVVALIGLQQLRPADAAVQEIVTVKTSDTIFQQGEPISILATVTTGVSTTVKSTDFMSEPAATENPCGIDYFNLAFIRGAHADIQDYGQLLALKPSYLNIQIAHSDTQLGCRGVHAGIESIDIEPEAIEALPSDQLTELTPKISQGIFDNQEPAITSSNAIVSYTLADGDTKTISQPLVKAFPSIAEYYDREVTREPTQAPEGFRDAFNVYRKSHHFEPGQYTIIASTMSGTISEPVIITIEEGESPIISSASTNALSHFLVGGNYPSFTIPLLISGAIAAGALVLISRRSSGELPGRADFGKGLAVFTLVSGLLMAPTIGMSPAFAAWDEGAQGIKVQSTGTDFKASATQDDFFGLRYASGALAANGQGTQNNAFISGQSIGSDYMWSQSLIQSYGNSGITYSTYTCVRYDSSNYTCYFPDEIVLKASQQFETGYGGGFFPCPWGWTTAQGNTHCYKINEGSEMTKDIGNAGKKRFDLNTYHEIMSDGKVKAIQKIRTCTSYTAGSCGSYETIRNFTTETVANSNQRFFCDSVGGTTYCPSSASVGWEGGSEFRPRSGTYVEHTYQINTATATESYKTGNVAPAESNKDICWWDSIDKSGSTNYKSTYTHNTASNCHS
jgi:hypothetical protein